jgi:hypothetical protein
VAADAIGGRRTTPPLRLSTRKGLRLAPIQAPTSLRRLALELSAAVAEVREQRALCASVLPRTRELFREHREIVIVA